MPWPRPPTVSTPIYQKYPQIQTIISARHSTLLHLHQATTLQSVLKTKSLLLYPMVNLMIFAQNVHIISWTAPELKIKVTNLFSIFFPPHLNFEGVGDPSSPTNLGD